MTTGRPNARGPAHQKEVLDRAVRDFQSGIDRERNFRLLYQRYNRPLQRFLTNRVFSSEERLDLTQECFLRIYQGLDGFRAEGALDTWVFRIAYHCYRRWLERQPAMKGVTLETWDENGGPARIESPASSSDSPDASDSSASRLTLPQTPLVEVLRNERRQLLREAIEELPVQMRRCTVLRTYQDLSLKEIAAAMRLSVDTVKVHLFRARKTLRLKLEGVLGDIHFGIGEDGGQ